MAANASAGAGAAAATANASPKDVDKIPDECSICMQRILDIIKKRNDLTEELAKAMVELENSKAKIAEAVKKDSVSLADSVAAVMGANTQKTPSPVGTFSSPTPPDSEETVYEYAEAAAAAPAATAGVAAAAAATGAKTPSPSGSPQEKEENTPKPNEKEASPSPQAEDNVDDAQIDKEVNSAAKEANNDSEITRWKSPPTSSEIARWEYAQDPYGDDDKIEDDVQEEAPAQNNAKKSPNMDETEIDPDGPAGNNMRGGRKSRRRRWRHRRWSRSNVRRRSGRRRGGRGHLMNRTISRGGGDDLAEH